jgi:hypothetical protein
MNATTTSEFLAKAKDIVNHHTELQQQVIMLQMQISQMENANVQTVSRLLLCLLHCINFCGIHCYFFIPTVMDRLKRSAKCRILFTFEEKELYLYYMLRNIIFRMSVL